MPAFGVDADRAELLRRTLGDDDRTRRRLDFYAGQGSRKAASEKEKAGKKRKSNAEGGTPRWHTRGHSLAKLHNHSPSSGKLKSGWLSSFWVRVCAEL
jgi:hypothetical protein